MFSFNRNVPKLWCAWATVDTSAVATSEPTNIVLIGIPRAVCRRTVLQDTCERRSSPDIFAYRYRCRILRPAMGDSAVTKTPEDVLPDVRDGLTREERVVLWVLHETQKERGGRNVPTARLWGRVCEHFYISPEDLSAMLARLGARRTRGSA